MNPPPRASRRQYECIFDAACVGVSTKTIRRWIAAHELIRIGQMAQPDLAFGQAHSRPSALSCTRPRGRLPRESRHRTHEAPADLEGQTVFRSGFSWTATLIWT